VFILFVFICTIATVIGLQVISFSEDFPDIKEKFNHFIDQAQSYTQQHFNISGEHQNAFVKKQLGNASKLFGNIISGFFSSIASLLTGIVLILVYTFLLLYNKERYEDFFLKIYSKENDNYIKNLLKKIGHVSQHYLKGRVITILILAVLYSVGLLLVGIKHAILFGCIAALLTIIPYAGTLFGGIFPFVMALITEPSLTAAVWVAVIMVVIQAIDNYFIEPNVIGGEVNLSALSTILSLIAGGLIWGIPGMILFIPLLGIAKIIFDNVEKLKPLGFLIGDPDHKSKAKKKR
jgi:predicted PurR-regulated permease PerM